MRCRVSAAGCAFAALASLAVPSHAEVRIAVERNVGAAATGSFTFKKIPAPVKGTAAAGARVAIARGGTDPNSGGLKALTDGNLPTAADVPRSNFFFYAETDGGCFRMDFGSVIDIAQVNTYSWHPGSRGPQVYKLYASDGAAPQFKVTLAAAADPVAVGWKFVASVDNRIGQPQSGGQYGVSISDSTGSLGRYRYLLFCCEATELYDAAGNTFYSEVNVIAK